MSTTEIICCLNELVKNTIPADGIIDPKITIIDNVKPDSFTWVIEEAIKALEKSSICKSTDFDDIWDL